MTLIETLIGALLFAFVATGVYMLYTTMQNTMSRGELMSDLQQNARIGLAQMAQEVRMAGYDPPVGTPPLPVIPQVALEPRAAIRAAAAGCFAFVADVRGVGTASQITYYLSANKLYRKFENWDGHSAFGGPSAQPLAQPVAALTFNYYDANNQLLQPGMATRGCPPGTSPAIGQLTFDQMRRIRRIAIVLRVGDRRPGICPSNLPPPQPCEFYTLTSDVRLRNL